ncbi:hypothetical protein [Chryseobacterium sp.]|uniref:hypothetical protein n=1 Tax=Chryseobacterium sp. TaxID=1871047 RepID=UPI0011CABEB5|nr:hypothetical protein [Chryseobacterium sp.]TXF78845.1 hypothetical protein FUA25_00150 [Chryseobacterium sp.]
MQKKLPFYEFTLLPDSEQFSLVFLDGEFKNSREVGNRIYCLYQLYDFLVEIEYDICENKIAGKVAFQPKV